MAERLDGKVAIVTGAARGMGAAIAAAFASEGARVVLADVDDDLGRRVADDIGRDVTRYVHLDVSDEQGWRQAVEQAEASFGGVDVLVNNAGIYTSVPIEDQSLDDYLRVVMVNQVGCWLGIKSVIAPMRHAGGGAIINTSSTAGFMGSRGTSAYAASKFALRGLTKAAAIELGPLKIRVNSVHPGLIDTDILGDARRLGDALGAGQPLPRVGTVEEVAALMLFLAVDATYSTGSEFVLDGGSIAGFTRR